MNQDLRSLVFFCPNLSFWRSTCRKYSSWPLEWIGTNEMKLLPKAHKLYRSYTTRDGGRKEKCLVWKLPASRKPQQTRHNHFHTHASTKVCYSRPAFRPVTNWLFAFRRSQDSPIQPPVCSKEWRQMDSACRGYRPCPYDLEQLSVD